MFGRLSQVARQLSRPLPHYAHLSAAVAPRIPQFPAAAMSGTGPRLIHTAAALIIGDEVLGGKVCKSSSPNKGDHKYQ